MSSADFLQILTAQQWALLLVACVAVYSAVSAFRKRRRIKLPTVGSSGWFGSFKTAFKFTVDQHHILHEGYHKYKGTAFMLPQLSRWKVLLSGPALIDEAKAASDDLLSAEAALQEMLEMNFTLGKEVVENPYHFPIIRGQLTRKLEDLMPRVIDEIQHSLEHLVPDTGNDEDRWVAVPGFKTVMQIVARISNRIFVGKPLCRNQEYLDLNIKFARGVMLSASLIGLFPEFLKPHVAQLFGQLDKQTAAALKHTRPLIEERLQMMSEKGVDSEEMPDDLLSWCMDAADGDDLTPEMLTRRLLTINFASINTTAMSFTHALFFLASMPEYIAPLREEIIIVTREQGWTKEALGKCMKLDSFMKESQRLIGLGANSMNRRLMKDHTFCDGSFVPAGTMISVPAAAVHQDPSIYGDNAREFDGFRFSKMAEEDGDNPKNLFVTTSVDYVAFGHGRHACPGRFFATLEMKAIMAFIIANYDVKFADGFVPKETWIGPSRIPDRTAQVLFKRRLRRKAPATSP
ncbi:cytochrome P450 [Sistotremastrum suecicum HHB10207 ss-3]|uniref:Cytochrome P450 n=1 Tax=Sistotremastrum suecicum HHB10207 ss-3 TaxID=1314776 RepID=A0A166DYX3_9AGAM|nr:cytochrome P450 [Sistotremastrum suecicum HHB10207 ss-3]